MPSQLPSLSQRLVLNQPSFDSTSPGIMIFGCVAGLLLIDSKYGGRRSQLLVGSVMMGPPLLVAGAALKFGWPWLTMSSLGSDVGMAVETGIVQGVGTYVVQPSVALFFFGFSTVKGGDLVLQIDSERNDNVTSHSAFVKCNRVLLLGWDNFNVRNLNLPRRDHFAGPPSKILIKTTHALKQQVHFSFRCNSHLYIPAMALVKVEHTDLIQNQAAIMGGLRTFWMEGKLCDVTLKSDDGAEHRAHTNVLCAASMYFQTLLCGSFLEADRVQQKQPVEIAASKAAVRAFLDYIYGGQPEVPVETALELQRLAERYDLPQFASAIEAGIHKSLDGVTGLRILQEIHGLYSLKDASEEKVAEDFEACSQHPDFGKLSLTQVGRILKRKDLRVSREEVVLKGIFNWFNFSKDRDGFGILLQDVDFQAFSLENLLRLGRFTLSGSNGEDLHREVDQALRERKRAGPQSSHDRQPKRRRCFKHWSPDLGATIDSGREVLSISCYSMCWHEGHIYATDYHGNVLCWKPGDPADTVRKVTGEGARVTGINDLGQECVVSIGPTGEVFALDVLNERLLRFENGCGDLVVGDIEDPEDIFCSPKGVVYVLASNGRVVQKLIGTTLQTVIDSESLPKHLQFKGEAIFVTKEEEIYVLDPVNDRVLCVNPAESLEPIVVEKLPEHQTEESNLCSLYVTEGGTMYVSDTGHRRILAFRRGDTTPTEVLLCPDQYHPTALLVQGSSLYVGMVDDCDEPTAGGIYEYLLPPELQLE